MSTFFHYFETTAANNLIWSCVGAALLVLIPFAIWAEIRRARYFSYSD